jgi:hypothetical protein
MFLQSKAKLSGRENVQLQIAARDGAARQLFKETGIDIREKLDRLTPAVLRMNPPVKNGQKILKNENDNRLFYFLQVEENDFLHAEVSSLFLVAFIFHPKGRVC